MTAPVERHMTFTVPPLRAPSVDAMISVGMSTSCAYPLGLDSAFELSREVGFDGVEIMVTNDPATHRVERLLELSQQTSQPILSIHAPVLLLTHFVWGRDPRVKLERSAELAVAVGAPTVVAHPPFRWQGAYAERFLDIVRAVGDRYGVTVAIENMFPWKIAGRSMKMYAPGWDPSTMDCDAATLDFSHASLSGRDSLELARALDTRLRHVHLCDGSRASDDGGVFDEHLVPGHGVEPVDAVLNELAARGWSGSVIAEINTRKAGTQDARVAMMRETLEYARDALVVPRLHRLTA
ncbi:sugar phosphate isomerase/epimerase [Frondihabitans sp. PAMC 28766]|uniref:sugar phosphate isomerase/epimerase family protein n=1 Tax=Frondihabitans sp. PAMC 28766 TaxID=1795630 RepID=UPI001EF74FFC|nr:sugar phosphate isomerase/epimerase family protein [Frondihabitans sp. PAMC 28766]